jgi:putative membrane protein
LKNADDAAWRRASPYAALYFLGRTVRLIAKNAAQVLAPAAAYLVAFGGDLQNKLVLVGTVLAIGTVVVSLLRYWFFRFSVTEDAVLIRDGIVRKKQLDIKFDRVQGISTEQNIVYRALGLVTVSFDTAGSAGTEAQLPAVHVSLADELRDSIGRRKRVDDDADTTDDVAEQELLRLDSRDMVRIGLADRRALVVLAVIGPLIDQVGEGGRRMIADFAEDATRRFGELDAAIGFALLATAFLLIALLLGLASIAAAVLRYHDYRLVRQGDRLRARAGLLTRHENALDIDKIQVVRHTQGIVLRLFRRVRIQARSASSGGKQSADKSLLVPVAIADFAASFQRLAFAPEGASLPTDPRNPRFEPVSPRYMLPRLFLVGLLPAVTAFSIFVPTEGVSALTVFAWLPVSCLLVYRSWRRCGYAFDADGLVRRSGIFGYRLDAFLFRKMQRVTVRQSWFQARRGLASLRVHLAAGQVTIPYIGERQARDLQDYLLYKAEVSRKTWY